MFCSSLSDVLLQCWNNSSLSAVSSLRTGHVMTSCIASKVAWVLRSRAPGTHGCEHNGSSLMFRETRLRLMMYFSLSTLFQATGLWAKRDQCACKVLHASTGWRGEEEMRRAHAHIHNPAGLLTKAITRFRVCLGKERIKLSRQTLHSTQDEKKTMQYSVDAIHCFTVSFLLYLFLPFS